MGRRRCLMRPGSYGLTCDGQYLALHWSLVMTFHGSTETSPKTDAECVLLVCLVTAVLYGWRAEWRRSPCRPDAPVCSKLLTSKVCPKISSHSLRQYLPRGLHIRKPSPMVTESSQCFQDHINGNMQVCCQSSARGLAQWMLVVGGGSPSCRGQIASARGLAQWSLSVDNGIVLGAHEWGPHARAEFCSCNLFYVLHRN